MSTKKPTSINPPESGTSAQPIPPSNDSIPQESAIVIDVWANADAHVGEAYISTDRFGRLLMSAGLVEQLSLKDRPISYYLGYVKDRKSIALGPIDVVTPTDAKPAKFDKKRHYASVRRFYEKHALPYEAVRYYYDGKHNGWLLFKPDEFRATDRRATK